MYEMRSQNTAYSRSLDLQISSAAQRPSETECCRSLKVPPAVPTTAIAYCPGGESEILLMLQASVVFRLRSNFNPSDGLIYLLLILFPAVYTTWVLLLLQ